MVPNITSGSSFYGVIAYKNKGEQRYGKGIVTP